MSDIMLYDITYEVDGKLYTTRLGYDHSWLCDISMDDLVPTNCDNLRDYEKIVALLIENHFVETSPYETIKHLIETHQDYKEKI